MSTLSWLHVLIISTSLLSTDLGDHNLNLPEADCNLGLNYDLQSLGGNNYKILVNTNENGELKYYFMDGDQKLLNSDFTSNEMIVSKSGKYYCFVVQSKTCHNKLEIEI